MAIANLIDTTFTAKNIATALSVYEYTVPGSGLWYHLYIQVRLYQVAGGGDYTINLRLNDGDALADDPMVPKTSYTAAAGLQNLWFAGEVIANSGDVLNIMCLGQAGDNAVTGSIRICCDDAVGATVYGRTLDVTTTGEAGIDWNNINGQSSSANLSNTTIANVTAVGSVSGAVDSVTDPVIVGTNNDKTGYALSAAGITALVAAIWAATTRTLTNFGTLVADLAAAVWAYIGGRTLTQSAASVTAALTGSTLNITRSDSYSVTLTGLPDSTGFAAMDFLLKEHEEDDDTAALVWIRKSAPPLATDGLRYLNKAVIASPVTKTDGALTVVSSTSTKLDILPQATYYLKEQPGLVYALKYYYSTARAETKTTGVANIGNGVIRAIA